MRIRNPFFINELNAKMLDHDWSMWLIWIELKLKKKGKSQDKLSLWKLGSSLTYHIFFDKLLDRLYIVLAFACKKSQNRLFYRPKYIVNWIGIRFGYWKDGKTYWMKLFLAQTFRGKYHRHNRFRANLWIFINLNELKQILDHNLLTIRGL